MRLFRNVFTGFIEGLIDTMIMLFSGMLRPGQRHLCYAGDWVWSEEDDFDLGHSIAFLRTRFHKLCIPFECRSHHTWYLTVPLDVLEPCFLNFKDKGIFHVEYF